MPYSSLYPFETHNLTIEPLLAKEPQPDISYVEIDDDEDDQPVAGPSSYQSAFKQGPASRIEVSKGRGSTDKEPVPISSEEEDVQASVPPDGRHSRWLKEKIKPKPSSPSHSSQTSIIDDFSEPELKESSKPGFVRAQVKKIEGKRVDLNQVVNVRNGMKPKLQPLKVRFCSASYIAHLITKAVQYGGNPCRSNCYSPHNIPSQRVQIIASQGTIHWIQSPRRRLFVGF